MEWLGFALFALGLVTSYAWWRKEQSGLAAVVRLRLCLAELAVLVLGWVCFIAAAH